MSDYKSELLVEKQAEIESLRTQLSATRNEADAALTRVKELEAEVERRSADLERADRAGALLVEQNDELSAKLTWFEKLWPLASPAIAAACYLDHGAGYAAADWLAANPKP